MSTHSLRLFDYLLEWFKLTLLLWPNYYFSRISTLHINSLSVVYIELGIQLIKRKLFCVTRIISEKYMYYLLWDNDNVTSPQLSLFCYLKDYDNRWILRS